MADGKVEIETEINTAGIDKGSQDVENRLKKFEADFKGFSESAKKSVQDTEKPIEDMGKNVDDVAEKTKKGNEKSKKSYKSLGDKIKDYSKKFQDDFKKSSAPLTELNSAVGLVTGTISKGIEIVKSYCAAINETAEAYNTQLRAEIQLQTAVKNNPLLDNSASKRLQDFASSVQEYSEYGDEFLMPFMAELASAGRTEEEIMKIITTSADVAASGVMDFGSAVSSLNATFNGVSGSLGRSIQGIKDLTEEEIKNGKAVELVAKNYEGMAKNIADRVGSANQKNNTFGDFMEEIGKLTKGTVDVWNNLWKDFWTKGIEAVGKVKEALDNMSRDFGGLKKLVDSDIQLLNSYDKVSGKSSISKQSSDYLKWLEKELEYRKQKGKLEGESFQVYLDIKEENRKRAEQEQELLKISKMSDDELKTYYDTQLENLDKAKEKTEAWKKEYQGLFDLIKNQQNYTKGSEQYNSIENAINNYSKNGNSAESILSVYGSLSSTEDIFRARAKAADDKMNQPILDDAQKLKKYYTEVINAKEKEIELREKSGEIITQEAKATELAQAKTKAYMEYLKQGGSENAEVLAQIKETYQQIKAIQNQTQATNAKDSYFQTLDVFEKQLELRKKMGEQITKEEEIEARLNTKREAYKKMREDSLVLKGNKQGFNYTVSDENAQISLNQINEEIKDLESELNTIRTDKLKLLQEALKGVAEEKNPIKELSDTLRTLETLGESVKEEINILSGKDNLTDEEINRLQDLIFAYEEYERKIKGVRKELGKLKDEEAKKTSEELEKAQKILGTLSEGINNLANALNTLSEMWTKQAQDEATVATVALEKQFEAGEVSEEEYYKKKEKIEKEAAEKSYKIQMWAWSAQLLQIGASTAQAIMSALATSGNIYAGIAMAATVGILGSAQMAAAIKSKPVPPSYAMGGIVGGIRGASMGQDNTYAHVRTGEAILNAKQQRELWNIANGRSGSSSNGNVTIKNYRGNDTKVSTQFSEDGLQVLIRKIVQEDIANGNMNNSLMKAENSFDGNMYI